MRVKILVFPLVLGSVIAIFIAYVWPQWESLNRARLNLKESEETLRIIQEKKNNIENLKNSLNQNASKEDLVLSYLPVTRGEEEVINGINYLATSAAVSLVSLSLEKTQEELAPDAMVPLAGGPGESASSGSPIFNQSSSDAALASQSVEPRFQKIKAKIGVTGTYENIKAFLEQLYKMEMFNDVSSLSISTAKQESAQEESAQARSPAVSGILSASLEVDFGYMSQYQVSRNYISPIFSTAAFDFGACDKLSGLISKKIPALEVGGQGRANPFLP